MPDSDAQSSSELIAREVARVLERNSTGVLTTLVVAPAGVGLKLLVDEAGARTGGLGDARLDELIASHAPTFLASRHEAQTFKVTELTGDTADFADARVMFERIEPEPRLVICGAGHVGA